MKIEDISVSDRLNLRNRYATLEDMKDYCNIMADMIEDFMSEIKDVLCKNEELKEQLEDIKYENEELRDKIKEYEE